jgi:hypothetical protein
MLSTNVGQSSGVEGGTSLPVGRATEGLPLPGRDL